MSHIAQLAEVHAGYGPNTVLKGVTLDVVQGEQLVVVGPKGAGKSTLLRVLSSQLAPTSGTVSFSGGAPRTAVAGQAPLMFDWLTVAENVRLGKQFRSVTPAVERSDEVVALFELGDLAGSYRHEISDEAAQRVSLARAFSSDAELLLLDEPLAGLVGEEREQAQQWLRRVLVEDGLTSVIVTDDLAEAFTLGDRVVVIGSCGRVLATLNMNPTDAPEPELISA